MAEARVAVVGAGVGGLTAAAVLARSGLDVAVLEAHVLPGGCASTFPYQGYRFDAGATLAAGFGPGGPMEVVAAAAGVAAWPVRPAEHVMDVHLPDGAVVPVVAGAGRWAARLEAFGPDARAFFTWQERTADVLWALALGLPPWPVQRPGEAAGMLGTLWRWGLADPRRLLGPGLLVDAVRPVARRLSGVPERLRLFVDAQLLIAAQVTSERANALYAAAALDLPRRGVAHVGGGMGALAESLARAAESHGARVRYRAAVRRITPGRGGRFMLETRRGAVEADVVLINLPPPDAARLFDQPRPALGGARRPRDAWGAFVVYAGVDAATTAGEGALHHQVVTGLPLGEGNSVFASLSPVWDAGRAPAGRRALTLSTHTRPGRWLRWAETDPGRYEREKQLLTERVVAAAERALPGLVGGCRPLLPGTPVTFARFTGRETGWVGGYPQTSLARARGPRVGRGLWLVGDSVFPGQSTAAVALGGLRVARAVLDGLAVDRGARRVAGARIRPEDGRGAAPAAPRGSRA